MSNVEENYRKASVIFHQLDESDLAFLVNQAGLSLEHYDTKSRMVQALLIKMDIPRPAQKLYELTAVVFQNGLRKERTIHEGKFCLKEEALADLQPIAARSSEIELPKFKPGDLSRQAR